MNNYIEKVTASIEEAKEKLKCLRTENSLVFPIFTDLHTEDVATSIWKDLYLR